MPVMSEVERAYFRALSSLASEGFGNWSKMALGPIVNYVRYRVSLVLDVSDHGNLPDREAVCVALSLDSRFTELSDGSWSYLFTADGDDPVADARRELAELRAVLGIRRPNDSVSCQLILNNSTCVYHGRGCVVAS